MTATGAATRATTRSARAWRGYDRANMAVVATLAIACVGWWAGEVARPPASAEPIAPSSDSPVRMRLSDSALDLRREGDRVVLRGQVRDAAARDVLAGAAQRHFGAQAVDDQLAVDAAADPLTWAEHADALFDALRRGGPNDGVRVLGHAVSVSGSASTAQQRDAREAQARRWFGARFQIDNLVAVDAPVTAPAASAPGREPVAESIPDCAGLAQGVSLRFRAGAEQLAAAGRARLDGLAACLAQGRWRVGSVPDPRDAPPVRDSLARQRAQAAVAYLGQHGVAPSRLEARDLPSADLPQATSAPGSARERRVVIAPAD
jgi:outer membrane protein OmpA-like peptidoglycan-associated protein